MTRSRLPQFFGASSSSLAFVACQLLVVSDDGAQLGIGHQSDLAQIVFGEFGFAGSVRHA